MFQETANKEVKGQGYSSPVLLSPEMNHAGAYKYIVKIKRREARIFKSSCPCSFVVVVVVDTANILSNIEYVCGRSDCLF